MRFDDLLQSRDEELKRIERGRRRRVAQAVQLLVTLIDTYERSMLAALGTLQELRDVEIARERPGAPRNGWAEASVLCRCHTALIDLRLEATFAWQVGEADGDGGMGRVGCMRVSASRRRANAFTEPVEHRFCDPEVTYPSCGVELHALDAAIREAIRRLPPDGI